MVAANSMTPQEKEWRAEDDSRTIRRYNEIMADEERRDMAKEWLEKDLETTAKALGVI